MKKPQKFGPWNVRVEGPHGRCAAVVEVTGFGGDGEVRQCQRAAGYGYMGQGFCYQHHPDTDAHFEESSRLTGIAQQAVNKALQKGGR